MAPYSIGQSFGKPQRIEEGEFSGLQRPRSGRSGLRRRGRQGRRRTRRRQGGQRGGGNPSIGRAAPFCAGRHAPQHALGQNPTCEEILAGAEVLRGIHCGRFDDILCVRDRFILFMNWSNQVCHLFVIGLRAFRALINMIRGL